MYNQIFTQRCNYTVTLTASTINQIAKNTKKIAGKAYKNSRIMLYDSRERIRINKTIKDETGKFVLSKLDLKKWAVKKLVIKIPLRNSYGQYYTVGRTYIEVKKK